MNSDVNNIPDNGNEFENKKKKNTLVIALACAIVVAAIALSIAVINVAVKGRESTKESTLNYVPTTQDVNATTTTTKINLQEVLGDYSGEDSQQGGASQGANGNDVPVGSYETEDTTEKPNKGSGVEFYEQLSPNGENKLSDHFENKYIKLISEKYDVDADLLVAIYSDPDTGNNFVLEFSGKTDDEGLIVKSPDTLKKVYHIDQKGEISVTAGKETGNEGVSYAEGVVVFNMIKVIVMEQYPDYFTGLKK